MVLSDKTIFKMLEEGSLQITPLDPEQVQDSGGLPYGYNYSG